MRSRNIFIGLLLFVSYFANAQNILDWVLDPKAAATNYATQQANEMWDGFLGNKITQNLSSEAQKIANYQIDTAKLDVVDEKYQQHTYGNGDYNKAVDNLREAVLGYIYITPKGGFKAYGKGSIIPKVEEQIATRMVQANSGLRRVDLLLRNHPEIATLQKKWEGLHLLYNNPAQLYYWGVLAPKTSLSSKYKLPSAMSLEMRRSESLSTYDVYDGERRLGTISFKTQDQCDITVEDIDILNYHGMPNATYTIENSTIRLDNAGRTVFVEQICNASYQKKSALNKKNLKIKQISTLPGQEAYSLTNLKYNGIISGVSVISIPKNKANKSVLKAIDKQISDIVKNKQEAKVSAKIQYLGAGREIDTIIITVNEIQYKIIR